MCGKDFQFRDTQTQEVSCSQQLNPLKKQYHCDTCGKDFQFTATEILNIESLMWSVATPVSKIDGTTEILYHSDNCYRIDSLLWQSHFASSYYDTIYRTLLTLRKDRNLIKKSTESFYHDGSCR